MADYFEDDADRLEELAQSFEPALRRRFLEAVARAKAGLPVDDIAELIFLGRIEQAVMLTELAAAGIAGSLSATWSASYVAAGADTAKLIADSLQVVLDFDQVNEGAVAAMQANKLELVREFTSEQRLVTQSVILDGVRQGVNPKQVAVDVKDAIGLTSRQQAAVANYKRLLESGSKEALQRQLRDRRFDSSVARGALSNEQVARMTQRYQERYLAYRAQVIARTEGLTAAQQGSYQTYVQAVEDGSIEEEEIERKWITGKDGRTRESHRPMEGQLRGLKARFLSGNGNHPLFPGDPSLPGNDRIQCRCSVATRIRRAVLAA